jgi:hypothetical protein
VYVNPLDRWNKTPLDDAIRCGHTTVVSILKEHGAKLHEELPRIKQL